MVVHENMTYRVRVRFRKLLGAKEYADGRKWTYRDIAEATGVSKNSVSHWANEKVTQYHQEQIKAFCKFFGCTVGELIVLEAIDEEIREALPAAG